MTSSNDWIRAAQAEAECGNHDRCVQFANYAIARDPDSASAWSWLGWGLFSSGLIAEGVEALETASTLGPLTDRTRIELAIAYGALGKRSLSRDLLMMSATTNRLSAECMLRVAAGLEAVDEPELAMEACRRAGRLNPEWPEVHFRMATYAALCGYPSTTSEALYRHAIDLDSENLHYRVGLVSLLIRLNRSREAMQVIDRFVPSRLEEITCTCCLKRIANLYFDIGDLARASACSARYGQLMSVGTANAS
ncbi:MAG: hypothetical protein AAGA03_05990 [Planctomycetota bacterium]